MDSTILDSPCERCGHPLREHSPDEHGECKHPGCGVTYTAPCFQLARRDDLTADVARLTRERDERDMTIADLELHIVKLEEKLKDQVDPTCIEVVFDEVGRFQWVQKYTFSHTSAIGEHFTHGRINYVVLACRSTRVNGLDIIETRVRQEG